MPYFAKISRQNLFVFVFIEPKSKRKRKKDNKFRGQKVVGYQKSKVALCIQQFQKMSTTVLLEVASESRNFARKIISVEKILASGNGK